jgi:hypothetical protein
MISVIMSAELDSAIVWCVCDGGKLEGLRTCKFSHLLMSAFVSERYILLHSMYIYKCNYKRIERVDGMPRRIHRACRCMRGMLTVCLRYAKRQSMPTAST